MLALCAVLWGSQQLLLVKRQLHGRAMWQTCIADDHTVMQQKLVNLRQVGAPADKVLVTSV